MKAKEHKTILFKELSVTCEDDIRLLTKFYIARVVLVDAKHEKSPRELMELLDPEGKAHFFINVCCCNKSFGITMLDCGDDFNHVYVYIDDEVKLCSSCSDQFEQELVKQCLTKCKCTNYDLHYLV